MSAEVYKLIRVTGSDAAEFLQGQLTQDMARLVQSGSLPAAWCNPKGRVITLLRLLMIDGGYGLVLPASIADSVCERLAVYRLRADVSLGIADSDWDFLVINAESDLDKLEKLGLKPDLAINACRIAHGLISINVGIEEACVELMGFKSDLEKAGISNSATTDELRGAKIRAGIPEIIKDSSETYTPHMLNLDMLGAISFDKGCYTGQEVVARTQNLGSSKRRLMRYRAEGTAARGDTLNDGQNDVGKVLNVCGKDLLAVTPINRHEYELVNNSSKLTPVAMPY